MRFFRKIEQSDDLRASGRRGRARVRRAKLLDRGEPQVPAARAEHIVAGDETTTMKLELEVTIDGERPYRVKVKQPIPTMEFTKMVAGSEVGVLVAADDKKRVEVDWNAPITEPSLEERAKRDPMLRSLLNRRVDPPPSSDP